MFRGATAKFWQPRPPERQSHQRRAAAAAFYSAEFRQGPGLGGLSRRGGPEVTRARINLNKKSGPKKKNDSLPQRIQKMPNIKIPNHKYTNVMTVTVKTFLHQ